MSLLGTNFLFAEGSLHSDSMSESESELLKRSLHSPSETKGLTSSSVSVDLEVEVLDCGRAELTCGLVCTGAGCKPAPREPGPVTRVVWWKISLRL